LNPIKKIFKKMPIWVQSLTFLRDQIKFQQNNVSGMSIFPIANYRNYFGTILRWWVSWLAEMAWNDSVCTNPRSNENSFDFGENYILLPYSAFDSSQHVDQLFICWLLSTCK
jgi:hypothetical protein